MKNNQTGRVRQRLAKLLQSSFPTTADGRLSITWKPEWLYPSTGSYRTNVTLDCYRWEGFGKHVRADGSDFPVLSVGSYHTMSELVKVKHLRIISYEVVPDYDAKEEGVTNV